ncbi:MAG: hypothetical protein GXY85_03275 [Candidatus Brocadiaceae bacterium]|nr:hypothetical protein [Candidatus Brocadiaceae bacterium]
MTALTSDRVTGYSLGDLLAIPVAGGECIYCGALVCANADGCAVPAADAAGLVFEGIATERADNDNGDDGDVHVVVRRRGRFRLDYRGALTQAAMAARVCAVDDHTVDAANNVTHEVHVGRIDRIEGPGECWVYIDGAVEAGRSWNEPTTTTAGG